MVEKLRKIPLQGRNCGMVHVSCIEVVLVGGCEGVHLDRLHGLCGGSLNPLSPEHLRGRLRGLVCFQLCHPSLDLGQLCRLHACNRLDAPAGRQKGGA